MKSVSSAEMKKIDQAAIHAGTPGELLMERAGIGVAQVVIETVRTTNAPGVIIFAGKGNNGGDAFVAARHLAKEGIRIRVIIVGSKAAISGDAYTQLQKLTALGIPTEEVRYEKGFTGLFKDPIPFREIVLDGILGIGIKGPATGPADAGIQCINKLSARNRVISIDIPSGLNSDTGVAEGNAVFADHTVTIGLPKTGLLSQESIHFVGSMEVVDIGLPEYAGSKDSREIEMITAQDLFPLFPRRPRNTHKGDYGHLLIIAGAKGFSGAASIAAASAMHSGVGLVSVLTPASLANTVSQLVPEAMVFPGAENSTGGLSESCTGQLPRKLGDFDAFLLGPGMTSSASTLKIVEQVLAEARRPVILDADALNVFKANISGISKARCPIIITPHPGELGTLLGLSAAVVQRSRLDLARRASELCGGVVVLKGAGTIVANPGRNTRINMTGNPGMASGGMGDALSGLIAGFLAQGFASIDAASSGVYLHGRAGDLAVMQTSEAGLTAWNLILQLPKAFRALSAR